MLGPNQVPAKIEQVTDNRMCTHKTLSLSDRLESPHPPLSNPGRLMRLLGPIILILLSTVNRLWHELAMCNTIAELIRG